MRVPAALAQVPVLLNCYANEAAVSSVVPAEVAGGHTATDHLLAVGHRRIGYINGEPWQDAARDRLKGYRTALATATATSVDANGAWQAKLDYARIEKRPVRYTLVEALSEDGKKVLATDLPRPTSTTRAATRST